MAAGGRPAKNHGGLLASTRLPIKIPQMVKTTKPGKFHRKKAKMPPHGPARDSAVEMTNWVLVGPGKPCVKMLVFVVVSDRTGSKKGVARVHRP
jgi:hypothetical protein